jgi:hypothetical protein
MLRSPRVRMSRPQDYHCLPTNVHAAGAHASKRSPHRIDSGFIAPLARDPFPAFQANAIGPCALHQKRYFLPAIKPRPMIPDTRAGLNAS